jgi:hypothetical protein
MRHPEAPPYGRAVVTLEELQARVASSYSRLDLPSWPDPHPGHALPRDEEYSRLTDPERYRIVHARAGVWARVLEDAVGVRSETLAPDSFSTGDGRWAFDRGVRLDPPRAGALPLLLLERDVPTRTGEGVLAVLHVAVARPDVVVDRQPDCGCDACDSGSDYLLEAIDEAVRHVVGGPFVVLRGRKWGAEWHPSGGSAGGEGRGPDFRRAMDLCRRLAEGERVRLPKDTEAFVGRSWLD